MLHLVIKFVDGLVQSYSCCFFCLKLLKLNIVHFLTNINRTS